MRKRVRWEFSQSLEGRAPRCALTGAGFDHEMNPPLGLPLFRKTAEIGVVSTTTDGCDFRHSQSGQGPGSIVWKNMTWRFNLVASALVVILLAMPLSALGSCLWHMAPAEHCTPHCPMMSGQAPSFSIQEASADGSCCQVSAAKPTSVPQAPSGSSIGVAPTFSISTLDTPSRIVELKAPDLTIRACVPSPQAVLCTFLV